MVNYELAVQLRKQGMKYADIAEQLNCSIDWCKKRLKGVPKRQHKKPNPVMNEEETKLFTQIVVIRRELNKLENMLKINKPI